MICALMPDASVRPRRGRPRVSKVQVLRDILCVLDNGAKWKDLPRALGAKSTVHSTFKRWVEEGAFAALLQQAGRMVAEHNEFKMFEFCINGTFRKARGGGDGIGVTKAARVSESCSWSMPRACQWPSRPAARARMKAPWCNPCLMSCSAWIFPRECSGDKAYDCDALDHILAQRQVEMIAPHRSNHHPENKPRLGIAYSEYLKFISKENERGALPN